MKDIIKAELTEIIGTWRVITISIIELPFIYNLQVLSLKHFEVIHSRILYNKIC